MENFFLKYRQGIIGHNQTIKTPLHESINLVYADWTASGRMYLPIEERIQQKFLPYVANTHTDTNYTGSKMTYAYHKAQEVIKRHVNASTNDVLISSNSGMTGVVNKFQRILGLKVHESLKDKINIAEEDRPIDYIYYTYGTSFQSNKLVRNHRRGGDCSTKPGWIRLSIHPTHTNEEIKYLISAIHQLAKNHQDWSKEYEIDLTSGCIKHKADKATVELNEQVDHCFT